MTDHDKTTARELLAKFRESGAQVSANRDRVKELEAQTRALEEDGHKTLHELAALLGQACGEAAVPGGRRTFCIDGTILEVTFKPDGVPYVHRVESCEVV